MRALAAALVVTAVLAPVASLAQTPATPAPAFEVASVKHNVSGEERAYSNLRLPNRLSLTNAPLRDIVARAFEIDPALERFTLTGGPAALLAERYDIEAKPASNAPPAQMLAMLRTLLAERFNLRVHTETRQIPTYALIVAREGRVGPDLRSSDYDCESVRTAIRANPATPPPRGTSGRVLCAREYGFGTPRPGALTLSSAGPLEALVRRVQAFLDRPIADATGLRGNFEWTLVFAVPPSRAFEARVPLLADALEDQLGLKLERRTGPIEMLVIDSVRMPTPD